METVYLLRHPLSGEARYVGVTCRAIEARMKQHYYHAERQINRPVCDWIRVLWREGMRPIVEIIEVTDDRMREAYWIAHYRSVSGRMLNMSDGGRDNPACNPAVAAKISAALKGRKLSPEHLEKCRNRPHRKHTEIARAKMRKPKSEQHRVNAAAAIAAKRASGEYRAACGDANGARKYPERLARGGRSPGAKLDAVAVLELRRRYSEGAAILALGNEFGVATRTARMAILGKTWAHLPNAGAPRGRGKCPTKNHRGGRSSPHAKLTAESVGEIRRLAGCGVALSEIARQFSISDSHAGRIARGLTWKAEASS